MIQQIKKWLGIKRKYSKKAVKEQPKEICVPVYIKNPNPLVEWENENSNQLSVFLRTQTGKLLLELFRVAQVKKMMAATNDGDTFKCGEARGYGEAVDMIEQMSLYQAKQETDTTQDFRVRGSWGASSNVVINESPKQNNV